MNVGLRALLLVAAIVCFIIAIFVNRHVTDWMSVGLACTAGSFLVTDLGFGRGFGTRRRT